MRLGIDLGTTRTVVALCDGGNYPVVQFADAEDELQEGFPSAIAARGSELRFGWAALACAESDDWTLLPSFKRLLGAGSMAPVPVGDRLLAPHELLTAFLGALREALYTSSNLPASYRDDPVTEAIVATPAHADSSQRFVTLEAFRQAGFQIAGMMNEPSAAGVEYAGRYRSTLSGRREKIVVYDLGGGTFDASLVHMAEARHDVLASAGLPRLGGDDFDALLLTMVLEAAALSADALSAASQGRLRLLCRQLKEALHPNTRRLMVDVGLALTAADRAALSVAEDASCVVDVGAYYERCRPLIDETIAVMAPLLATDADGLEAIAGIYVVGGASALPVVGRVLKEAYGRRVHRSLHPTAATAVGLARAFAERETFTVQDRLSRSFGVFREAAGGERVAFDLLLDADQPLPPPGETRSIVRRYRPVHTIGHLRFVECAGLDAEGAPRGDVSPFAEVRIPYDPALRALDAAALAAQSVAHLDGPGPLIEERYTLDNAGILELVIRDVERDFTWTARVSSSGGTLSTGAAPA